MLDKVQVMAISPKILSLDDPEILNYVEGNYIGSTETSEWLSFMDDDGRSIKVSRKGILESKKFVESGALKQELIELFCKVQTLALSIFKVNPTYDVFIYGRHGTRVGLLGNSWECGTAKSFSFSVYENVYVDLKVDTFGYKLSLRGILDMASIMDVCEEIKKFDEKVFKVVF